MTAIRNASGRFQRIPHDTRNPWVLVDFDCQPPECVVKCPTRAACREHQRVGGGRIVRTHADRRRQVA